MVNRRTVLTTTIVLIAALSCLGQDAGSVALVTTSSKTPASTDNAAAVTTAPVVDNRPASGAQPLGLGLGGRKELNISLNANQSWDSNGSLTAGTTSWQPVPSFGGAMRLVFDTAKAQTVLNYSGNGIAYPDQTPIWTTYQNLSFSQIVHVGRWTVTGIDAVSYAPNSPFGGYGYALNPDSNTGTAVVNPQFVPNQSILTPATSNYFNTVIGQLEYGISRRSSWTASGSYGMLRFLNSDLYNVNQVVGSTGYNHSISSRDTVFANYNYSQFSYSQFNSSFTSQNVQLGYSRRVTGRMSFQVSGGPELTDATSVGAPQRKVQFAGNANLAYSRGRTSVSATYFGGTTGGSGVFTGAETQNVQVSVGRSFGREWSTSLSAGYSHNSGLVQQQTYNLVFVSPSIRRALTRNLGVSFNYSYQRQPAESSCTGLVCDTLSRNFASVGVDYRFRPIHLE